MYALDKKHKTAISLKLELTFGIGNIFAHFHFNEKVLVIILVLNKSDICGKMLGRNILPKFRMHFIAFDFIRLKQKRPSD